jgi:hypothetical protein
MNLDKFFKLKNNLETFNFENNFNSLSKTLYYFSFLGNIFLILFSYFFIKNVTNSIPTLFTGQGVFFSIFIILFMVGYELFKRFAFEQLTSTILRLRKFTLNILLGTLVSLVLVAGSFYLSLNGAHRLIDTSETIVTKSDSTLSNKVDSIGKYYDKEILYYRNQSARTRSDKKYRDSIVNVLQRTKDEKVQQIESRTQAKTSATLEKNTENSTAFLFITIFLEMIVLIGVGFDAFYTLGSYEETKKLLQTPKFKQLELNLKLLKLYYQNGKKVAGDQTLSFNKFKSLAQSQKVDCSQADLKSFVTLCQELDIVKEFRGRKKEFMISYIEAKHIIESQEVI